jgi:hypothetical protein
LTLAPVVRMSVGVVVERRKARSPWIDVIWRPAAALGGSPDATPWTELSSDGEAALFYAGQADLELHRSETVNYRDNLASGSPSLWIALRQRLGEPPCEIAGVTADPAEGECWTEPGDAIVEAVAMPEPIREAVAAFVKQHYVETIFSKRERDRADPEALARHAPVDKGDDERS